MPTAALPLTIAHILRWADAHRARTGDWPRVRSGCVAECPGERWVNIDQALRKGFRGLPGGDSLARLLDRERGVRNVRGLPPLTEDQVLAWACAHRERTGAWPTEYGGAIPGTRGEVWANVDVALREGYRGLPGGDSLAQLLARRLGACKRGRAPRPVVQQILDWADAHFRRTGRWPGVRSGSIPESPDQTWKKVDESLRRGRCGLPGGSSLARLLAEQRGKRTRSRPAGI